MDSPVRDTIASILGRVVAELDQVPRTPEEFVEERAIKAKLFDDAVDELTQLISMIAATEQAEQLGHTATLESAANRLAAEVSAWPSNVQNIRALSELLNLLATSRRIDREEEEARREG